MKTLKDLIEENSPLLDGLNLVYKINSDVSYHIATAMKNPELYSIHKYYEDRPLTGFKALKTREIYLVDGGRVMVSRRGIPIGSALDRPDRYQPLYSKIITF